MKKSVLFIVFLMVLGFVQCKPKREPGKIYFSKPSDYNDYIVKEQKEVMASFDDFADAVNHGDRDSMSFLRKTLYNRTTLAEQTMKSLADFKKDTLFRHAALELFQYIGYACNHELKEMTDIASKDSTINEMDIERIRILSETYTIREKEKNDALITAQENFAKKFNVTIQ